MEPAGKQITFLLAEKKIKQRRAGCDGSRKQAEADDPEISENTATCVTSGAAERKTVDQNSRLINDHCD
ncbi:MAG: hypothetical protein ACLSFJ_05845 [Holdemania filiformis]